MQQKNYYQILGVDEHAGEADIKRAFRTLARQCHPDHHPGDPAAEARFKEINEAYDVLGDAEKRRKYDELRRYSARPGAGGGMSYDDFLRRFGGQRGEDQREFTWGFGGSLDDIFSTLFGGGHVREARHARSDAFHRTGGPRTDGESVRGGRASRGARRAASEPQPTADPFFKRSGADAYVDVTVNLAQAVLGSTIRVRTPGGGGVKVKIPAGLASGAVLRVRGQGYEGPGTRGDLYIRTHLQIPASLTDEQREAMALFAERCGMKY